MTCQHDKLGSLFLPFEQYETHPFYANLHWNWWWVGIPKRSSRGLRKVEWSEMLLCLLLVLETWKGTSASAELVSL